MPASVNLPISAGIPYSSSKASRQDAAPAPPVFRRVPSISNRIAIRSLAMQDLLGYEALAVGRRAAG
jgi:hypothetical protein